jgi:predicted signal transduction protein with EAL and GGDEF domain
VGRSICEYLGSADRHATPIAEHYDALQGTASHFEYKRKNRFLDIHLGSLRSASGEIIGCIGVGLDITERKKTEDEIRHQATHDALTGLANYGEFVTTLEREVRRASRSHHPFTVLLLDLDDLKKINDRFGHLAGNRALQR